MTSNNVTVVNFNTSWCDLCRRETPELIEYQDSRGGESLDVVGISIDDSDSSRDKFLEEFGVTYPVYEFADEPAAIESYKIHLMPTTFFVDSEGRSEEHTSELQSRFDLVCRLLLEKKK